MGRMPENPTHDEQPAAAGPTERIEATVADRLRAAEVQRRLCASRPVWELVHQPAVLDALLVSAARDEAHWWRPARVALQAIATWRDLPAWEAAEEWLLSDGRPVLELAGGKASAGDLSEEPLSNAQAYLIHTLVRDACMALYIHAAGDPLDRIGLAEGVLVCLYDFCQRAGQDGVPWLTALAAERPDTAARVLLLNHMPAGAQAAAGKLASNLAPIQALAFVRAVNDAGATEMAATIARDLLKSLPQPPATGETTTPDGWADAAVGNLHRGLALAVAGPGDAVCQLEAAWESGRMLAATLAQQLGEVNHHACADPNAALAAYRFALQLTPANVELRAATAAVLNDLAQHHEALDILAAVPLAQVEQDFGLAWQQARALAGQGDSVARVAAGHAADLAATPEQHHWVAGLMADLGQVKAAAVHLQLALRDRPGCADWHAELGELYARQADWPAAESSFRQRAALEPSAASLLRLVDVLQPQRNQDGALSAASEAAQLEPENSTAQLRWVQAAHAAGQWEATLRAGQVALSLLPDSATVHIMMGQAFAAQGQDDEALYYLQRATDLTAEPAEEQASWLALAGFHRGQGDLCETEQVLEAGLRAVGENGAQLLGQLALLYQATGRPTEAQITFQRAYQAGDRSCELLTRFGRVLSKLGHHQQAVAMLEESVSQPDASGPDYHALALALELAGRPLEAAAAARQAAALMPDDGQVLLDAGRMGLAEGDSQGASELLATAADLLPDSRQVWELLGRSCEAEGDWEAALDAYWTATRLDPAGANLQQRIGVVCTQLGRYETAITLLKEAADSFPDDPAVQESLAEALEAAGWWHESAVVRGQLANLNPSDPDRMIAWARSARQSGDLQATEEAIGRARRLAPQSREVQLEWGLLQQTRGDTAGALQTLRELLRDCEQPAVLWSAGRALVEMGQLEPGLGAYSRAADLRPESTEAQVRLADAAAAAGNLAQALGAYQVAARLEPNNPAHHAAIGRMYWQLAKFAQAAEAWDVALELNPADLPMRERLAAAYARMGDPAAALVAYEEAAMLAIQQGKSPASAWREAGRAALALGEFDKARACLSHALQSAPRDPETHSLIGALADQLGRPEEALAAYRKAAELAPEQRGYQLQLADALTKHGHDLDAVDVWERLVDGMEGGDNVEMLEQMGVLYSRAGRFADAERALRAALDRSGGAERVQVQLGSVLVEQAERQDYQRRAAVVPADQPVDLPQAVAWLDQADTPQSRRDMARARLMLGGVNEAVAGLNAYLANVRSDLSAQRALGVAYRLAGMHEASIEALSTAARLAPSDERTTVELAQSYLAAGQLQAAVTLLDRLASQSVSDPVVLYHLAVARREMGEEDGAMEALEEAVAQLPETGRWHQTLSAWHRQVGNPVAALPHAEAAVQAQGDSEAQAELARVLADLGRPDEAASHWQAALDEMPDRVDWWLAYGHLLLAMGQAEAAADSFARASQLAPEGAAPYLGRAQALLALDDLDEAGRLAQQALKLDANLPAAHACLGHWQAASGSWKKALASYQTAVLQASNGVAASSEERAHYLLHVARAYHALGSSDQAIQELERAAQIAPASSALFTLMGDIYLEQESRDLARQAYQQAAKVAPANADNLMQLAQFLQDEGQLDQALDWLMKAIAVQPAADLWLAAARIYEQRGQRGKQLEALHRAVNLEPAHGRAHYELGLAYKQRKEYQMAINAFERVTELEPNNAEAHKQLSAVLAISLAGKIGQGSGLQMPGGR